MNFPIIDPTIHYISVSGIRNFNLDFLRKIDGIYIIQYSNKPLSVMIKYETYLAMQNELIKGKERIAELNK